MKIIVGLGNPGIRYQDTRHNIGFIVVKALAKDCKVFFKKDSQTSSFNAKAKIKNQDVILALPFTFMNLSGGCVSSLLKKYKVLPGDLLVICDDLDLTVGRQKIRLRGSSGGHRGLNSIIKTLGAHDFSRLRIGIGRPLEKDQPVSEYVLSCFSRQEKSLVKKVIVQAVDCCRVWVNDGVAKAMNIFNASNKKGISE